MAPSSNRRSGSSRRAQYTTFIGYLVGGAGAVVGAAFLIVSIINPGFMSPLRGVGSDVVAPASRVAAESKAEGADFFETISGYLAAGRQNAGLRREIERAKVRLIEADGIADENARLKVLLGLMAEDPKPVAAARLIGSSSASTRRFATLGVGARDGVTVGMPVRSPLGLVGRVLETSDSTARVLLITDGESLVPVRRASDGIPAFAQGRGDGTLQIRLINLGINPLKRGDTFVTSGSGGLYRPNTPIAVVASVTTDGAIAHVLSDPASNDYVVVEQMWASSATAPSAEADVGGPGTEGPAPAP
jgi:rod shape-determining protein MreC